MRRYPAFDPPEYLAWTPEWTLVREFGDRLHSDPERAAIVAGLTEEDLLRLYADLLQTRLHDIALKRWVRQGVISKAWLGTGEEAVTVGSVHALDRQEDVVCPMIRNAGACPMMGMALEDLFRGYLATADSPNGGRDLHIGDLSRGVLQPISHMGTNVAVMAGVALAFRYRDRSRVALTWVGDGATKTAECHEGATLAAVLDLPAVFVLQNNQVALGTRLDQHGAGEISAWPDVYGLPSWTCDGNNVLDVLSATRLAVERCRRRAGPAVVVAHTFRMGGHATHDEREARETFARQLFQEWGRRDPIGLFEEYLVGRGISRESLERVEHRVTDRVEGAANEALLSRDRAPKPEAAQYEGFSAGGTLQALLNRPV